MSQPSRKEIENRAYELWKKSGRPEGREEERNEAKSSPFDWAKIMSYNDDANWNLASLDPATPMPPRCIGVAIFVWTESNSGNSVYTLLLVVSILAVTPP